MATLIAPPAPARTTLTGDDALRVMTSDDGQGLTTIRIRGVVDASTDAHLRDALRRVDGAGRSLLLDLTGVRQSDAQGRATLLAFAARIRRGGLRLALLAPDGLAAALAPARADDPAPVSITVG